MQRVKNQRLQLKYQEVSDGLDRLIRKGELAPGQKLPSEQDLSRRFKVNLATIRRGLEVLRESGLIETRSRVGNFVRSAQQGEQVYRIAVQLRTGLYSATAQALAAITMQQINDTIDQRRFGIMVLPPSSGDEPLDPIDHAVANGIHGLLIYPNGSPAQLAAAKRAMAAGVKISLLSSLPEWNTVDAFSVTLDDIGAARQIVSKFVALGHRNIAVVLDRSWDKEFYDKYVSAMADQFREYSLGRLEDHVVFPSWNPIQGERNCSVLTELFGRSDRPTALLVPDESFALGVVRFCYRHDISIPDDLSIASIQDFTPYAHPIPLSAPDSSAILSAGIRASIQNLMDRIEGRTVPEKGISLRCDVQWTNSVAAVRA